jgi:hypothetical protein
MGGKKDLEQVLKRADEEEDLWKNVYLCEELLTLMNKARTSVDKLERKIGHSQLMLTF